MDQEKANYLYRQVSDELAARVIQIQYHPTRVALDQFHLLLRNPESGQTVEIFTAQEIEHAVTALFDTGRTTCG